MIGGGRPRTLGEPAPEESLWEVALSLACLMLSLAIGGGILWLSFGN